MTSDDYRQISKTLIKKDQYYYLAIAELIDLDLDEGVKESRINYWNIVFDSIDKSYEKI